MLVTKGTVFLPGQASSDGRFDTDCYTPKNSCVYFSYFRELGTVCRLELMYNNHRIIEWCGLEGTLKII